MIYRFGSIKDLDICIKHLKKLGLYGTQQVYEEEPEEPRHRDRSARSTEESKYEKPRQDKSLLPQKRSAPEVDHLPKEEVKTYKRTLFIRNLSDATEEEDLQALFLTVLSEAVQILDIRVVRDEEGKKRGIAFVDVADQLQAEKALKLNNYNLKGKAIKVDLSKPPSEG